VHRTQNVNEAGATVVEEKFLKIIGKNKVVKKKKQQRLVLESSDSMLRAGLRP